MPSLLNNNTNSVHPFVNMEEGRESEAIITKHNKIIVDIPDQPKPLVYRKAERERRNVPFFKQFLLPRVYGTAIISFIVICVISGINDFIINKYFKQNRNGIEENVKSSLVKFHIWGALLKCFVFPVIEEFIFRRFVFGMINKYSKIFAYILSTFLYAYTHFSFSVSRLISEYIYLPYYLILGFIFGYTYDYDGYLTTSILSNMFMNIAVVIYYFIKFKEFISVI
ncbi:hypothetical protein BCR32DRAFT_292586 [Anaeromyces robustus]|uniref:CAAX prenyl protease 2/Lysostaphin resistance protein A-like domain-containing protein n=1 Tax=Anaeromyces robustus TaxID=1754192 RepID=A0A1Y1XAW3_9FUNG|nr:hypothetical protein BCR32DRAFT_292586 [Anaeromyces robustus]|eukprot:ORX82494.1 hypothetical protein BCR32DRAFT_292586 [Anaeromyces robustus]